MWRGGPVVEIDRGPALASRGDRARREDRPGSLAAPTDRPPTVRPAEARRPAPAGAATPGTGEVGHGRGVVAPHRPGDRGEGRTVSANHTPMTDLVWRMVEEFFLVSAT